MNIYERSLKGLAQAKSSKNRWFYFGFYIRLYDVNMSIDYNCKSFLIFVLRIHQLG